MKLIDNGKNLEKATNKKTNLPLIKKIKKRLIQIKKFFLKKNINYNMKEVTLIMLITFVLGMIIGGVIISKKNIFGNKISASLNEFAITYEDILNNYYDKVDSNELLQSGIEGMVNYLSDPYATYMNEEEAESFNERVEGAYSGIGAGIIYDNETKQVKLGQIFENSPAALVGLKNGDILLQVNSKNIDGLTTSQIASLVKGQTGTTVKVTIKRLEKEITYTIKRGNVDIESVTSKIIEKDNKKVGYIDIDIFASNTYKQFSDNLKQLENKKIDSLIIDLRGNTGGYLTTVTDIISMFTKKDSVIYQLSTKGNIEKIKDKTKEARNYPIYILVNGGSASASEVLASSLKENYGATLLGTRTYGKGKVQKAYSLSNGAKIKYTFQEWLTPKGNSIDSVGIEPNIVSEYIISVSGQDNQLDEALEKIAK